MLQLQKSKLKEISQLKNQQQTLRDSLDISKKKLEENSELVAVNMLFRKLKDNFDGVKVMISDLHEIQSLKGKTYEMQKELQEKQIKGANQEYKARKLFSFSLEEEELKHKKCLEDFEKEKVEYDKYNTLLENGIFVIQNEYSSMQQKHENIRKENKVLEESIMLKKQFEKT